MNYSDVESLILNKDFLIDYIKDKPYLYVTTITEEYVDMAYNWFLSLKKLNQDHLALIVAIGEKCYLTLQKLNIPSIFLNLDIKKNDTKEEWVETEKKTKLLIPFYILQKYEIKLFISDVDIFFNKNPYLYIEPHINDDYDMFIMNDKRFDPFLPERKINEQTLISTDKMRVDYCGPTAQQIYGEENGGFSFININKKNYKKLFDCFVVFSDDNFYKNNSKGTEDVNLQTLTNQRYKEFDIKIKKLKCFDFVNGSIWKIRYLNEKIKNTCCMVHYNFCEPYELEPIPLKHKKIQWMKENNHWIVD
jgi:hypothetical protein